MPPTTSYSFGDIVLVPFPFTDQSGAKKRPAGAIGEVQVRDWKGAGPVKASVIKPVITTIEASLVIRRLGQIRKEEQEGLRKVISKMVG